MPRIYNQLLARYKGFLAESLTVNYIRFNYPEDYVKGQTDELLFALIRLNMLTQLMFRSNGFLSATKIAILITQKQQSDLEIRKE